MTITAIWRRAASLVALGALAALTAACTISSEANLITPDEAVQPLAQSFTLTSYSEQDGVFTKGEDEPVPFALGADGGYAVPDNSLMAYFVPARNADTYLMSLVSADGTLYALARLKDDIFELGVVFSQDPGEQLSAAGAAVPAGVTVSEGGLVAADRAALDSIVGLIEDGTLSIGALVSWVGAGPAPATLRREGDWYVPG